MIRSGVHVLWDAHLARLERLTRPTSGDALLAFARAYCEAARKAWQTLRPLADALARSGAGS